MIRIWGTVVYQSTTEGVVRQRQVAGQPKYFSAYQTTLGQRVCQTEQEAHQLQLIISHEIANGTFNPLRYHKSKPLHLKKYSQVWLEDIKSDISLGTWHGYETDMRLHIQPVLGNLFLPDIGHPDLKRLMSHISHLAVSTKQNILGCLHKMMKDDMRDGHLTPG